MVFQMYELRGFLRKRFVHQFWHHLLILSFLTLGLGLGLGLGMALER